MSASGIEDLVLVQVEEKTEEVIRLQGDDGVDRGGHMNFASRLGEKLVGCQYRAR